MSTIESIAIEIYIAGVVFNIVYLLYFWGKDRYENKELDEFRNEYYPDDVLVTLYRKDKPIEKVWVRCEFVTDRCMFGILLNEPYGELDYHENEVIGFEFYGEKDNRLLLANGLKAELVQE